MSVLLCLPEDLDQQVMSELAELRCERLVARRCADLVEVFAAAGAGIGSLLIVSGDEPHLDLTTISELQTLGVRTAIVAGNRSVAELRAVGAHILSPDVGEIVALIRSQGAAEETRSPARRDEVAAGGGHLVAVWGPHGSHGRTLLARELAVLSGGIIIDADTFAPSLAQLCGLEETSSIVALARALEQGRDFDAALEHAVAQDADGARIITGLNTGERWRELSAAVLERMWGELTQRFEWVVVDVSGGLSAADSRVRADRYAAARTALEAAGTILHCGSAHPIGLRRLLEHWDLYEGAHDAIDICVVAGARRSSLGADPTLQLGKLLAEDPPASVLRDDRARTDASSLSGRALTSAHPRSPLAKDIASLWERVAQAVS